MITLIADASFCSETRAGGYAFQIHGHSGCKFVAKPFPRFCKTSTEAELFAVINAFNYGIRNNLIKLNNVLKIRTDCDQVIRYLTSSKYLESSSIVNDAIRNFNQTIAKYKLEVQFQHIVGHSRLCLTYEAHVHVKCDRASRRCMRQQRKTLIGRTAQAIDTLTKGEEIS